MAEIALTGKTVKRNKAEEYGFVSVSFRPDTPTTRPLAVRQQRRANLSAPFQTARTLVQAASLPPQGCNEPHFHGGGDTSSSRRREATKKWSGLCQPRRP